VFLLEAEEFVPPTSRVAAVWEVSGEQGERKKVVQARKDRVPPTGRGLLLPPVQLVDEDLERVEGASAGARARVGPGLLDREGYLLGGGSGWLSKEFQVRVLASRS